MFDKMLKKALGFRDEDEIFGNSSDVEGPGDPEIMGGMGGDKPHEAGQFTDSMNTPAPPQMKLPGGPVVPGVDRATGKQYRQVPPTQQQSATDYPGQGGMRGYPTGGEADRMKKAQRPPLGGDNAGQSPAPMKPGLNGTVYTTADGRTYDLKGAHPLQHNAIIDLIEKNAPLAERWRAK